MTLGWLLTIIKDLFNAVIKVLQDIEQEDGKAGADAASLLKSISTFSFLRSRVPGCCILCDFSLLAEDHDHDFLTS